MPSQTISDLDSTSLNRLDDALHDVREERFRQEALRRSGKFLWTCCDITRSNEEKLAVLAEEFGEISKEVVEGIIKAGKLALTFPRSDAGQLASTLAAEVDELLRKELVQVAAVCVAWIEAIDGKAL